VVFITPLVTFVLNRYLVFK